MWPRRSPRPEYSLNFATRTIDESGFLDAFERHSSEILCGLKPEHLPEVDTEVIREWGSSDAEAELAELVYRARECRVGIERMSEEVSARQQLGRITEQVDRIDKEFEEFRKSRKEQPGEPPKKSRRWFKGFGQIGQGAAPVDRQRRACGRRHSIPCVS